MKKVIGLTGGPASGKSTVANMFSKLGAKVIDADKVGHLVQKQEITIKELVNEFGESIYEYGAINRRLLGKIVFKDKNKLTKLNQIMQPKMYEYMKDEISKATEKIIIIDMAILFESGFNELCDDVLVVFSSETLQLERLAQRYNSTEIAQDIINSQLNINEKIKLASYVIKNETSIKSLKAKVETFYEYLLEN